MHKLQTLKSIHGQHFAPRGHAAHGVQEWIIILIAISIAVSFVPLGGH